MTGTAPAAITRRFAAIGSSHLFGLVDEYIGPIADDVFQQAWRTGVPLVASLPLAVPQPWQGGYVLYNTATGGQPPVLQGRTLYIPAELSATFGHIAADTEVIFSLLRGQEFAIAAIVDDPSHADFIGDDGGFEPGRRWMSRTDAQAWVQAIAQPLLTTHLALRQQFPHARIVHIPAPPPIEDEAHILAHAEGFGPLFARFGIKPFAMRKRIHDLMYAELNRQLAEHGIASLPPPPASLTPAGGLMADHARGCLHGNTRYAQGLAVQIREVLAHVASV